MKRTSAFALYPLGVLAAVALGSAVLAFSTTFELVSYGFAYDVRTVVSNLRDNGTVSFVLPVAWLAVWASRSNDPRSVIGGVCPGASRLRIAVSQSMPPTIAILVGWLAGALPASGLAMANEYWIPVDLLAFAVAGISTASLFPLAYMFSTCFGVKVGAFAVPMLLLAVVVIPATVLNEWLPVPGSTVALAYSWFRALPSDGDMFVWSTELLRGLFFMLVAFVCIPVAAGICEFRASRNRNGIFKAGLLAIPISASLVVSLVQPFLWLPDEGDQVRCEKDGFTLCLYQIDEPDREQITSTIGPILALLPNALDGITVSQGGQAGAHQIPPVKRDWEGWISSFQASFEMELFANAGPSCLDKLDPESDQEESFLEISIIRQVGNRTAKAITNEKISQLIRLDTSASVSGFTSEEADRVLDSLSDEEFRKWYADVLPKVKTCELREKDLP